MAIVERNDREIIVSEDPLKGLRIAFLLLLGLLLLAVIRNAIIDLYFFGEVGGLLILAWLLWKVPAETVYVFRKDPSPLFVIETEVMKWSQKQEYQPDDITAVVLNISSGSTISLRLKSGNNIQIPGFTEKERHEIVNLISQILGTEIAISNYGRDIHLTKKAVSLSPQFQNAAKCPACGAPLPYIGSGMQYIKCKYCDTIVPIKWDLDDKSNASFQ